MKIFTDIFVKIIKLYQILISPYFRSSCRYEPTCSNYFIQSLNECGLIIGTFKGLKRLLSCHPIVFLGGGSGFDPVKKRKN